MTRLLRVELTRLRWRRAVVVLLLIGGLLTGLILAAVAWDTRPYSAADIAEAEQRAEAEAQEPWIQESLEDCLSNPEDFGAEADPDRLCSEAVMPSTDWYLWRATLDLGDQIEGGGTAVALVVAMLLILIGTTFAGADWSTGAMSNQLIFEPRRSRVWWAKALALVLVAALASAALLSAFWVGLWLIAESRDLTTSQETLTAVAGMAARAGGLAVAAALGGFALTMLFRSTVATLGVLFAVVVASSVLVMLLPFEGTGRWLLSNNVLAVLYDGFTYFDESLASRCGGETYTECSRVRLGIGPAAAYLGALLGAAILASWASFRRRDVG